MFENAIYTHCAIAYLNHDIQPFPTVNVEIFARIVFLRITLKDTFVTLKVCDFGMIYPHRERTE